MYTSKPRVMRSLAQIMADKKAAEEAAKLSPKKESSPPKTPTRTLVSQDDINVKSPTPTKRTAPTTPIRTSPITTPQKGSAGKPARVPSPEPTSYVFNSKHSMGPKKGMEGSWNQFKAPKKEQPSPEKSAQNPLRFVDYNPAIQPIPTATSPTYVPKQATSPIESPVKTQRPQSAPSRPKSAQSRAANAVDLSDYYAKLINDAQAAKKASKKTSKDIKRKDYERLSHSQQHLNYLKKNPGFIEKIKAKIANERPKTAGKDIPEMDTVRQHHLNNTAMPESRRESVERTRQGKDRDKPKHIPKEPKIVPKDIPSDVYQELTDLNLRKSIKDVPGFFDYSMVSGGDFNGDSLVFGNLPQSPSRTGATSGDLTTPPPKPPSLPGSAEFDASNESDFFNQLYNATVNDKVTQNNLLASPTSDSSDDSNGWLDDLLAQDLAAAKPVQQKPATTETKKKSRPSSAKPPKPKVSAVNYPRQTNYQLYLMKNAPPKKYIPLTRPNSAAALRNLTKSRRAPSPITTPQRPATPRSTTATPAKI
jgi:hypothetical protein